MPPLRRKPRKARGNSCYDRLDLSKRQIRVLVIHSNLTRDGLIKCDLRNIGLDSQHTCLSYTWGLHKPTKTIRINGRYFHIRPNLWGFLNMARLSKITQPLWIDALCINQGHVGERNHQVQMMGDIYRSATEVLVWLGKGDEGIELALDVVKERGTAPLESVKGDFRARLHRRGRSSVKSLSQAIDKLATLPYWGRLWTKQEIMLNPEVRFLYGRSQIQQMDALLCQCLGYKWCSKHNARTAGQHACTKIFAFRAEGTPSSHPRHLQDLVTTFSGSKCSEVRDRIYGLLSLAQEGDDFEVDYSISLTELFVRTVSVAPPSSSRVNSDMNYLFELVGSLVLSDFDLHEEALLPLAQKYGLERWCFKFNIVPIAVFADSSFRQNDWSSILARCNTRTPPDRLLELSDCGVSKANLGRNPSRKRDANGDTTNFGIHRSILDGNSGLLSGDLLLKFGSRSEISHIFIVARPSGVSGRELEFIAEATSPSPLKRLARSAAHDNSFALKIFDVHPRLASCTSLRLSVKPDDPDQVVGVEMSFDIVGMTWFVRGLSNEPVEEGMQNEELRKETDDSMRRVFFSEVRNHEGRPVSGDASGRE